MLVVTAFVLLFGISGGEILIIMLVVLMLFGPSKIPEIARLIGRGINEVKKVQREINTEIQRYSAEVEKEAKKIQTDINELKQEIKQGVEEDQPAGKAAGQTKEEQEKAYEYNYDQYGLQDDYTRTYGQAPEKPPAITQPDVHTSATGHDDQVVDLQEDGAGTASETADAGQQTDVNKTASGTAGKGQPAAGAKTASRKADAGQRSGGTKTASRKGDSGQREESSQTQKKVQRREEPAKDEPKEKVVESADKPVRAKTGRKPRTKKKEG